jgi:hypothetical protein
MYVTPREFRAAPTGVDVSQLVPAGDAASNAAALVMQLQRASAYADNFCQKVLAATVNTQAGFYPVRRHRTLGPALRIPLNFTPIVAVSGVSIGSTPASVAPLSDLSNIWIGPKTVTVPVAGTGPGSPFAASSDKFATVQYVNGWANTALTAGAAPGATSITVASALGIMPGQQLNIQNATQAETVTVAASWVPSNTAINVSVPITTPVVGTYAAADTVTAFPQDIKQAVILIAKSFIKTRGSESITIASVTSQPDHVDRLEPGVTSDLGLAEDILSQYKRGI